MFNFEPRRNSRLFYFMIKVQDHIHNASGMRDSGLLDESLSKLDEWDKLALWMDYNIEQRFKDYQPDNFEDWKKSQIMGQNTSMKQWYLWHFQKI